MRIVLSYATLSYIWGGPQSCRTTTGNVLERVSNIDMESLPQTLKDAITVCRALEISYLWVDVLCIIQDDPRDVAEQINQMGDIFRGADVTLVAATSSNSNAGFLSDTFDNNIPPFLRCRYRTSNDKEGSVYLIKKPPGNVDFPIENRAWTMQERLLSSRLLVFHTGRIDWICQTTRWFSGCTSSHTVNNIDDKVVRDSTQSRKDRLNPRLRTSRLYRHLKQDTELALMRWYSLVSNLTKRRITYLSDRLPAVSAIAKEYKATFPGLGRYMAGLWEGNLAAQLLWRVTRLAGTFTRSASYLSPSWSWASVRCSVAPPYPQVAPADVQLSILDYKITAIPGSDEYGQISSAYLKVRGRIKIATWDISQQVVWTEDTLSVVGKPHTTADYLEHWSWGPLSGASIQIYCLEIEYRSSPEVGDRTHVRCSGLLLRLCEKTPMNFQRVGVFYLSTSYEHRSNMSAAIKNPDWFENAEYQDIVLV